MQLTRLRLASNIEESDGFSQTLTFKLSQISQITVKALKSAGKQGSIQLFSTRVDCGAEPCYIMSQTAAVMNN